MLTTRRHSALGAAALSVLLVLASYAVRGQTATELDLTLVGLDGTRTVLARLPPSVYAPRISPDGTQVAYETRDVNAGPGNVGIWIADMSLKNRRLLPMAEGPLEWAPMWTPDGRRLVYLASGRRPDAVYWRNADGSGTPERLIEARSAEGWVNGGKGMRFLTLKEAANGARDYGIAILDVATRTITPVVDLPDSAQHSSAVSPDGRWIAYASNETGRYEVWLEPVPRTGARHRLTKDGGSHPLWRPDGRAIYFDRGARLYALAVDASKPSAVVDPVPLPIEGFAQAEYRRQFDMLPNGRGFLMLFPVR
jgi:eukaryotic-like serine/threonine-protein kinase